jgi:hypothetical protein
MPYRKPVIIFIALICLILSLTVFFTYSNTNQKILLGLTSPFKSTETETDLVHAVEDLFKGNDKITLDIKKDDTCYWIVPGRDENGHFIEIREYGKEFGECVGVPRNTNYIRLDQKVNMYSQGCVCKGSYVLERVPDGLKISKIS